MNDIIPLWLVNLLSFATVFAVMTSIGTTSSPRDFLNHLHAPSLLIRGLIGALVVVPAVGLATGFAFGLTLPEKVGVALMAIAPGAPLALRRALGSGADARFATALQIAIAVLGVIAMPFWVMIGNRIIGTHGFVDILAVTRQIVLAQLLPLVLGSVVKIVFPRRAGVVGMAVGRIGAVLLVAALIGQLIHLYSTILAAHVWPLAAAAVTTLSALFAGHLLAGPSPADRQATAIAGALRNVGLALLVAATNHLPPTVEEVIVSYWLAAFVIVSAYILLRRRMARWSAKASH